MADVKGDDVTIEIEDAKVDRETLANTIRTVILYVFRRLRDGVERPHPEDRDESWYDLFTKDVDRARCLRLLLEAIERSET